MEEFPNPNPSFNLNQNSNMTSDNDPNSNDSTNVSSSASSNLLLRDQVVSAMQTLISGDSINLAPESIDNLPQATRKQEAASGKELAVAKQRKKAKHKGTGKQAYIPSYVQSDDMCVVCGDASTGTHYRAMTCEGCKGFFRRTIQNCKGGEPNFVCKKNGTCAVNVSTRNGCQFCRFQRCIAARMDRSSVLNDVERKKLQNKIKKNRMQKLNHSVTEKEMNALQILGGAFRSTDTASYYRFLDRDKNPRGTISPSSQHIINFILSVPGMFSISSEDILKLFETHILDILVLRLTQLFDRQQGAIVFCDYCLTEVDLSTHPEMERIFRFVKRFSSYSSDSILLGLLCALRFLSTDGVMLTKPETVHMVMESILQLLVKYLRQENISQAHLLVGLTDIEDIREHDTEHLVNMSQHSTITVDLLNLPEKPIPFQSIEDSTEQVSGSRSTKLRSVLSSTAVSVQSSSMPNDVINDSSSSRDTIISLGTETDNQVSSGSGFDPELRPSSGFKEKLSNEEARLRPGLKRELSGEESRQFSGLKEDLSNEESRCLELRRELGSEVFSGLKGNLNEEKSRHFSTQKKKLNGEESRQFSGLNQEENGQGNRSFGEAEHCNLGSALDGNRALGPRMSISNNLGGSNVNVSPFTCRIAPIQMSPDISPAAESRSLNMIVARQPHDYVRENSYPCDRNSVLADTLEANKVPTEYQMSPQFRGHTMLPQVIVHTPSSQLERDSSRSQVGIQWRNESAAYEIRLPPFQRIPDSSCEVLDLSKSNECEALKKQNAELLAKIEMLERKHHTQHLQDPRSHRQELCNNHGNNMTCSTSSAMHRSEVPSLLYHPDITRALATPHLSLACHPNSLVDTSFSSDTSTSPLLNHEPVCAISYSCYNSTANQPPIHQPPENHFSANRPQNTGRLHENNTYGLQYSSRKNHFFPTFSQQTSTHSFQSFPDTNRRRHDHVNNGTNGSPSRLRSPPLSRSNAGASSARSSSLQDNLSSLHSTPPSKKRKTNEPQYISAMPEVTRALAPQHCSLSRRSSDKRPNSAGTTSYSSENSTPSPPPDHEPACATSYSSDNSTASPPPIHQPPENHFSANRPRQNTRYLHENNTYGLQYSSQPNPFFGTFSQQTSSHSFQSSPDRNRRRYDHANNGRNGRRSRLRSPLLSRSNAGSSSVRSSCLQDNPSSLHSTPPSKKRKAYEQHSSGMPLKKKWAMTHYNEKNQ